MTMVKHNNIKLIISNKSLLKRKMKWRKIMKLCIFKLSQDKEEEANRIDNLLLN